MHGWLAILGSPDMQTGRSAKLDPAPLKVAYFDRPQPVPEGDQDHGGVPVTVPAISGGFGQLLDLCRREVFAQPKAGVRGSAWRNLPVFVTRFDHPKMRRGLGP